MAKAATRKRNGVLKKKSAARATKAPARAASAVKRPNAPTSVRNTTRAKPARSKWVYTFGDSKAEGRANMRDLLGGKGANLAEMANLGLPVPPGFTITTEVCTYFYAHDKTYPPELKTHVVA